MYLRRGGIMLKKLKDFYKRNRVYSILMIISITCIIAIIVGVVLYFIGQTSKDKYGNRLNGIESVEIKESKILEIEKKISENELVKDAQVDIKGKLIYILITMNTGKHSDSEAIAQESLELFSEEEKAFYDILLALRDQHNFEYGSDKEVNGVIINDKCKLLAQKIKEIIDQKSVFADWLNNQNVRNQLKLEVKICLIKNGYPPQYSPDVFNKVMKQVENFEENNI